MEPHVIEETKKKTPGSSKKPPTQKKLIEIKKAEDCEMYRIVKLGKKLGEGAYGQVFQALLQRDHKFIVVKKIKVASHIA